MIWPGKASKGLNVNLVNQLQVSAESDDVLTVLRKARRLASKLGVSDIDTWLQHEQNGYPNSRDVPEYRKLRGRIVIKCDTPVPMGMGQIGTGIIDYPGPLLREVGMPDSIAYVTALIESLRDGSFPSVPITDRRDCDFLRSHLNQFLANAATFHIAINGAPLRAIPEAVKDRIMDWALELEQRGVHGDGMSFNDSEKEAAHSIVFNLDNCSVGQLNNMGKNIQGQNDG